MLVSGKLYLEYSWFARLLCIKIRMFSIRKGKATLKKVFVVMYNHLIGKWLDRDYVCMAFYNIMYLCLCNSELVLYICHIWQDLRKNWNDCLVLVILRCTSTISRHYISSELPFVFEKKMELSVHGYILLSFVTGSDDIESFIIKSNANSLLVVLWNISSKMNILSRFCWCFKNGNLQYVRFLSSFCKQVNT